MSRRSILIEERYGVETVIIDEKEQRAVPEEGSGQ